MFKKSSTLLRSAAASHMVTLIAGLVSLWRPRNRR